jgi:hypothetical protein
MDRRMFLRALFGGLAAAALGGSLAPRDAEAAPVAPSAFDFEDVESLVEPAQATRGQQRRHRRSGRRVNRRNRRYDRRWHRHRRRGVRRQWHCWWWGGRRHCGWRYWY